MSQLNVFLSVGSGSVGNSEQETFVQAIENRLRSEGPTPCTLGRNHSSSEAPLRLLQNECIVLRNCGYCA